MKVAIRADASLQMGAGHVMRCLTLADSLVARGAECQFICREQPGNLIEHIRSKGYVVHALPAQSPIERAPEMPEPAHRRWLGASWDQDAKQCEPVILKIQPDWLVVDHYALDARWETALKPHYRQLMVIDDLADRYHQCDVLLDQNLGRLVGDYATLLPDSCTLLLGPEYALLRPEFAALRSYSLKRREQPKLRNLLITMGGVDLLDASSSMLDALKDSDLPESLQITVVMGASAPWRERVISKALAMPWQTHVLFNVSNMAQLMVDADLCIGAAGGTSWERCCLGLPTIQLVVAENQRKVADALAHDGIAKSIQRPDELNCLLSDAMDWMQSVSQRSSGVSDGYGCDRVINALYKKLSEEV